jgi:hypothetical protein
MRVGETLPAPDAYTHRDATDCIVYVLLDSTIQAVTSAQKCGNTMTRMDK